jgi:hypothetical protein
MKRTPFLSLSAHNCFQKEETTGKKDKRKKKKDKTTSDMENGTRMMGKCSGHFITRTKEKVQAHPTKITVIPGSKGPERHFANICQTDRQTLAPIVLETYILSQIIA